MVRMGGLPGAEEHPDTKPEMDPRQRDRLNLLLGRQEMLDVVD